jgi:biopolymer transport protein TolR
MSRKRPRDMQGIYDVNMTPLIDVSLVLVVILLVATPMALQSSITVQRSAASAPAAPQPSSLERVEVTVVTDDSMLVNRTGVRRDGLHAVLQQLLSNSTTHQVAVRCLAGVTHGTFVTVLDEAKQCGAAQIAVLGR